MLRATGGDAPVTTGNYIDGVARPAEGGRTYALYNPARPDELVGHAALSSAVDVDQDRGSCTLFGRGFFDAKGRRAAIVTKFENN